GGTEPADASAGAHHRAPAGGRWARRGGPRQPGARGGRARVAPAMERRQVAQRSRGGAVFGQSTPTTLATTAVPPVARAGGVPLAPPATVADATGAWSRRHVLDLDDFSAEEIEHVLATADAVKEVLGRPIKQVPALRGVTVVTLFYEASTRTRVSFELAAKHLAADVVNVAASSSSVTKGESLLDT